MGLSEPGRVKWARPTLPGLSIGLTPAFPIGLESPELSKVGQCIPNINQGTYCKVIVGNPGDKPWIKQALFLRLPAEGGVKGLHIFIVKVMPAPIRMDSHP